MEENLNKLNVVEETTVTKSDSAGNVNTQVNTTTTTETSTAPIVKPKSNATKIIVIVLAVLLLLCCVCSGIFYYYSQSVVKEAQKQIDQNSTEINKTLDAASKAVDDAKIAAENNAAPTPTSTDFSSNPAPTFSKMPGTTICDATLCEDIWNNVSFLGNIYASCTSLSLKTTKLDSKAADAKSWEETWTLNGCNKDYPFKVSYTADAVSGTNFSVTKSF
jgi:hypothetical protein